VAKVEKNTKVASIKQNKKNLPLYSGRFKSILYKTFLLFQTVGFRWILELEMDQINPLFQKCK
jgi:hypothetical protein